MFSRAQQPFSNMKHSSAKKSLKDVKSKYQTYCKNKDKSSELKLNESLMELDPNSRKNLNKTDAWSFVPQINEKSKRIKRDLNISDHLYRDASHRKESKCNTRRIFLDFLGLLYR